MGVESLSYDSAYLLCSDGLSDLVEVTEIERILGARSDDDRTAVKALWAAAMNAGGRDNITICAGAHHQPQGPVAAGDASPAIASPEKG